MSRARMEAARKAVVARGRRKSAANLKIGASVVAERRKARHRVVALADELCNAIDLAEEDIGGARPIKDILAELGPAVDKAQGRR